MSLDESWRKEGMPGPVVALVERHLDSSRNRPLVRNVEWFMHYADFTEFHIEFVPPACYVVTDEGIPQKVEPPRYTYVIQLSNGLARLAAIERPTPQGDRTTRE